MSRLTEAIIYSVCGNLLLLSGGAFCIGGRCAGCCLIGNRFGNGGNWVGKSLFVNSDPFICQA